MKNPAGQADRIVTDIRHAGNSAWAQTLAKHIGNTLNRHYPVPNLWAIEINEDGGVVRITNLALSGNWGVTIRIPEIDSMGKAFTDLVVRLAGEVLERFNIRRTTNRQKIETDLSLVPRDLRGDAIALDYSR